MAKQLWILRHGDAVPHGSRPDPERELTDRGREQARAAGRALAVLGVPVAMLFTSPKVRALETATIAAAPLGVEAVVHEPLAEGFDREVALELAAACSDDERLLLVGHEPSLSQVVHDLTGARVDFKKGGVCGIRLHGGGAGELLVLLRPRELAAIGR